MPVALACASHAPMLLDERYASVDICREVRASFDRMAGFVKAFAPDIVIQFSPDHFHGFHYDNMPSFALAPPRHRSETGIPRPGSWLLTKRSL